MQVITEELGVRQTLMRHAEIAYAHAASHTHAQQAARYLECALIQHVAPGDLVHDVAPVYWRGLHETLQTLEEIEVANKIIHYFQRNL